MDLNRKRSGIEEKFFDICKELVPEHDLELYDLEYISGSTTLRIFIMNPETKTAVIEDCAKIDRALTPAIEEADWIPDSFLLEVSSPGVFRSLKTKTHLEGAIGEFVSATITGNLSDDIAKEAPKKIAKAKKFRGQLQQVTDDFIILEIKDFELKLDIDQVKKINLDPAI